MPGTPIQATDERVVPFSAEKIWSVLADANGYPNWYPPSVAVRVPTTTTSLVGTRFEIHPRGGRAFPCLVEALEAPHRMRMRYPGDFIVGTGEWRLESLIGGSTRVTYEMDVIASGWLAAILGRVLPFAKLHSNGMQDILAALEKETVRRGELTRSGTP